MKDFLVTVYRDADGSDCSMNGITSQNTRLHACWNDDDLFSLPTDFGNSDVVIKADRICGDMITLRAFVIKDGKAKTTGGMFGGNFIYCSDSRFPKIGDFSSPIPVHDRFEPQWVSDMLSH
jgi:hypothetical protein